MEQVSALVNSFSGRQIMLQNKITGEKGTTREIGRFILFNLELLEERRAASFHKTGTLYCLDFTTEFQNDKRQEVIE